MERQRRGERELKDREKEKENGKSEERRKKMLRQRNRQERRRIYPKGNKSDKNYKDRVTRPVDHAMLETPVPIWTLKLSNFGPG